MGARRGGLLCGLCLSNQHTSLLIVAPLVAAVICAHFADATAQPVPAPALPRGLLVPSHVMMMRLARVGCLCRKLAAPAAFFLIGVLPYLYLPWAASREHLAHTSWGGRDVASWQGFFRCTPSPPPSSLAALVRALGSRKRCTARAACASCLRRPPLVACVVLHQRRLASLRHHRHQALRAQTSKPSPPEPLRACVRACVCVHLGGKPA